MTRKENEMKKHVAHHNLTANGGRVASRKLVRPIKKIVAPVICHGYPIPLIFRRMLLVMVTGKEKVNQGRGRVI